MARLILKNPPDLDANHIKTHTGNSVQHQGDRFFINWDNRDTIPDAIRPMVRAVSAQEYFELEPKRERGAYCHKSADGELETIPMGDDIGMMYCLTAEGTELKDVLDLVELVKAGQIGPKKSYEKPRDGKFYSELESELAQSVQTIDGLRDTLAEKEADLLETASFRSQILDYRREMEDRFNPICLVRGVIGRLDEMIGEEYEI